LWWSIQFSREIKIRIPEVNPNNPITACIIEAVISASLTGNDFWQRIVVEI